MLEGADQTPPTTDVTSDTLSCPHLHLFNTTFRQCCTLVWYKSKLCRYIRCRSSKMPNEQ